MVWILNRDRMIEDKKQIRQVITPYATNQLLTCLSPPVDDDDTGEKVHVSNELRNDIPIISDNDREPPMDRTHERQVGNSEETTDEKSAENRKKRAKQIPIRNRMPHLPPIFHLDLKDNTGRHERKELFTIRSIFRRCCFLFCLLLSYLLGFRSRYKKQSIKEREKVQELATNNKPYYCSSNRLYIFLYAVLFWY